MPVPIRTPKVNTYVIYTDNNIDLDRGGRTVRPRVVADPYIQGASYQIRDFRKREHAKTRYKVRGAADARGGVRHTQRCFGRPFRLCARRVRLMRFGRKEIIACSRTVSKVSSGFVPKCLEPSAKAGAIRSTQYGLLNACLWFHRLSFR